MTVDGWELRELRVNARYLASEAIKLYEQVKELETAATPGPPTIAELLERKSLVAPPEKWRDDELEDLYSRRARAERYRNTPRSRTEDQR